MPPDRARGWKARGRSEAAVVGDPQGVRPAGRDHRERDVGVVRVLRAVVDRHAGPAIRRRRSRSIPGRPAGPRVGRCRRPGVAVAVEPELGRSRRRSKDGLPELHCQSCPANSGFVNSAVTTRPSSLIVAVPGRHPAGAGEPQRRRGGHRAAAIACRSKDPPPSAARRTGSGRAEVASWSGVRDIAGPDIVVVGPGDAEGARARRRSGPRRT